MNRTWIGSPFSFAALRAYAYRTQSTLTGGCHSKPASSSDWDYLRVTLPIYSGVPALPREYSPVR
jgi:hypothetical protein